MEEDDERVERPVRFVAPSTFRDSLPAWSPDGRSMAFLRQPGAGGLIAALLIISVICALTYGVVVGSFSRGVVNTTRSSGIQTQMLSTVSPSGVWIVSKRSAAALSPI